MRIVWIACALAGVFAAPVAAQRAAPTEAERTAAFVVHVRDGGLLMLPSKESLTLRELAERIGRAATEFDKRAAAEQPRFTAMPLIVHVEPTAPWHHVQTVLRVAEQQRCHRIWLARERRDAVEYINVALPGDSPGVYLKTERGLVELAPHRFAVYLVPRSIEQRSWEIEDGVTRTAQPTAATYLFGPREDAGTLAEATAMAVADAARARIAHALTPLVGVLAAPPNMPSHLALDALGAFPPQLYERIGILEAPLPERDDWDRRRLPFPALGVVVESRARVIGGDPAVTFSVAPWAAGSEVLPAESREVQPVAGFEAIDQTVRMPLAVGLTPDRGPWTGDRLVVHLTRRGELRARGHQFSLRALGLYVRGLVTARKLEGQRGPPRILLRVDGEAPWAHVQCLLTELKANGVERVEFGVRGAATAGDSARDAAAFDVLYRAKEEDGPQHDAFFDLVLDERAGTLAEGEGALAQRNLDRSQLDLLAECEVECDWGPEGRTTPVTRPLNVRSEWNGRPHYSVWSLARALVAARAASVQGMSFFSSRKLRVLVSATEKAPSKYVIAALARLSVLQWGEIWYFRPTQAPEAAREAPFLPYPKGNDMLRVRDGLERVVPERPAK